MVNSAAYPGLERKPGGPDNWVERAGGLPKYIERIAKHLHYERGFSISRAIATAVNTVKRWARMGKVAKYGDPNHKHVNAKTAAQAAAAVASWEAKRAAGRIHLSEQVFRMIDLAEAADLQTSAGIGSSAILLADIVDLAGSGVDLKDLAERAGKISDPAARATARSAILDLAGHPVSTLDFSSSIPPKGGAKGRAKDGRPSFKRQGKWGHGFVPLDKAAKEAKAKGSPIAMKRMDRLFGSKPTGRAGGRSGLGRKKNPVDIKVSPGSTGPTERATSISRLQNTKFQDQVQTNSPTPTNLKETSKQGRVPKRATQNWDEIPDNLKTIRNGKKYVLAEFGGKQVITEWVGGIHTQQTSNPKAKVMRTITPEDAAKLSPSVLKAMLANPRTPPSVRKALNKALQAHVAKVRGKAS